MIGIIIFFHLLAFFIGSIPIGYLIGLVHGVDVRKQGSGNTGATNISRLLGAKAGTITLLGDITKGITVTILSYLSIGSLSLSPFAASLGLCAILGHCFSPFLKFKGGKGVATSLGVFLILSPIPLLIAVVSFALVFYFSRYVSLSSITASFVLPISIYFFQQPQESQNILFTAIVVAAIVIWRHNSNINRLLNGEELKYELKKAKLASTH